MTLPVIVEKIKSKDSIYGFLPFASSTLASYLLGASSTASTVEKEIEQMVENAKLQHTSNENQANRETTNIESGLEKRVTGEEVQNRQEINTYSTRQQENPNREQLSEQQHIQNRQVKHEQRQNTQNRQARNEQQRVQNRPVICPVPNGVAWKREGDVKTIVRVHGYALVDQPTLTTITVQVYKMVNSDCGYLVSSKDYKGIVNRDLIEKYRNNPAKFVAMAVENLKKTCEIAATLYANGGIVFHPGVPGAAHLHPNLSRRWKSFYDQCCDTGKGADRLISSYGVIAVDGEIPKLVFVYPSEPDTVPSVEEIDSNLADCIIRAALDGRSSVRCNGSAVLKLRARINGSVIGTLVLSPSDIVIGEKNARSIKDLIVKRIAWSLSIGEDTASLLMDAVMEKIKNGRVRSDTLQKVKDALKKDNPYLFTRNVESYRQVLARFLSKISFCLTKMTFRDFSRIQSMSQSGLGSASNCRLIHTNSTHQLALYKCSSGAAAAIFAPSIDNAIVVEDTQLVLAEGYTISGTKHTLCPTISGTPNIIREIINAVIDILRAVTGASPSEKSTSERSTPSTQQKSSTDSGRQQQRTEKIKQDTRQGTEANRGSKKQIENRNTNVIIPRTPSKQNTSNQYNGLQCVRIEERCITDGIIREVVNGVEYTYELKFCNTYCITPSGGMYAIVIGKRKKVLVSARPLYAKTGTSVQPWGASSQAFRSMISGKHMC